MGNFHCEFGGCLWQCHKCKAVDDSEWLRKQAIKEKLNEIALQHAKDLVGKVHYIIRSKPNKHDNERLSKELAHLVINEIIEQGFGEGYNHEYYCLINRYIDEL